MNNIIAKREKRWKELKCLEEKGLIRDLQMNAKFILINANEHFNESRFVADFYYVYPGGEQVTESVITTRKGSKYQLFRLKQKIMYNVYNITAKAV